MFSTIVFTTHVIRVQPSSVFVTRDSAKHLKRPPRGEKGNDTDRKSKKSSGKIPSPRASGPNALGNDPLRPLPMEARNSLASHWTGYQAGDPRVCDDLQGQSDVKDRVGHASADQFFDVLRRGGMSATSFVELMGTDYDFGESSRCAK